MPQPGWTEHANEIVPVAIFIGKLLIAITMGMGSALIGTLLWIGRQFTGEIVTMRRDIGVIHDAMLGCDGCRESLGRRATDKQGKP